MAKQNNWRLRLLAAGVVAMVASIATLGSGCKGDEGVSVECDSTEQYFAEIVTPVLLNKCFACHTEGGAAKGTDYILKGPAEAGFIQQNYEMFKRVASTEQNGESIVLLKPTFQIPHEGKQVIQKGSPEYDALLGFVVRLKNTESCEPNNQNLFTGVELLNEVDTLRKATVLLVGRLPTEQEIKRVDEGGLAALEQVLDEVMTEEAFLEWVRIIYTDMFGTDFYLENASELLQVYNDAAQGDFDEEYGQPWQTDYLNPFWYNTAPSTLMAQYGIESFEELQQLVNTGLAREQIGLIQYVIKNNKPYTEILTADYMAVTPLTQHSYGVTAQFTKENDPLEYAEARIDGFPHAGVLTSQMMLAKHPTTATNRNRHRARMIMLWFLGTDILKTAEQPVDQSAAFQVSTNPTRDFDQCTVCHARIDPIAGTFQAFNDIGAWVPEPNWYQEMWPPGFGKIGMPLEEKQQGLQWLAGQIAVDDRFSMAAVQHVYTAFTGREPLIAPTDFTDPLHEYHFRSFLAQNITFDAIAKKFKASNYNFKTVVKEMIKSPYFRAKNAVVLSKELQAQLAEVGTAHLLTPEELHKKVVAVFGIPWAGQDENGTLFPRLVAPPSQPTNAGLYQMFYGGVDNDQVTSRIREPNGVMAAVAERMAIEVSCRAIPQDFARLPENRKLFKVLTIDGVEQDPINLEPETPSGLPIPAAEAAIKETIVQLHEHILGEHLAVNDEEVARTYALFLETWREGKEKLEEGFETSGIGSGLTCAAVRDPWTGNEYPADQQVTEDDKYIIRAWMAVATYLISDQKFLYE